MAYYLTFYSYKGGVGRSLALANVAWLLARRGKRVVVVDMDLEAPSLHDVPELRPEAGANAPGIMEYATAYARLGRVPGIVDYLHECPAPPGHGRLWIVPAGRLSRGYTEQLSELHWAHLHGEHGSDPFVEGLRQGLDEACAPHYVLIDSRTGLSDIGGLSTHRLANAVVLVFNLTPACLDGTVRAYRSMTHAGSRVSETFLVASPVPPVIDAPDSVIQRRIEQAQRLLSPDHGHAREALKIVYDPEMALAEELAVTQPRRFRAAVGVYEDLRDAIQRANPEEFFSVQEEAGELVKQGRTIDAVDLLSDVVADRPKDTDAQLALGGLLLSVGRPTDAAEHLRIATELSPNLAIAHRKLAEALLAIGEAESEPDAERANQALEALMAAERAGDTSNDLRLGLAAAHRQLGNYKEAAVSLVPEHDGELVPAAHLLELRAAFEQHVQKAGSRPGLDLTEFCDLLMGSVSIDNREKATALRAILDNRFSTRKVREFGKILREERARFARLLGPSTSALWDRIVRTGIDARDPTQVRELFDGTFGDGALALWLCDQHGHDEKNLAWLARGLEAEPANDRLLLTYSQELLKQQGADAEQEITRRYTRAMELAPEDAELAVDFGTSLLALAGQDHEQPGTARQLYRRAIESFRRVIELTPDDTRAQLVLAVSLSGLATVSDASTEERRGWLLEAAALHRTAIETRPDNRTVLHSCAQMLRLLGTQEDTEVSERRQRLEQAIELYQRADEVKPGQYDTLFFLAVTLDKLSALPDATTEKRRNLLEQAIAVYERATAADLDEYHALFNRAALLTELAELPDTMPEQAIQHRTEAIEMYRSVVEVKADEHKALNGWAAQLLWLAHLQPQTASERFTEALDLLKRRAEILDQPIQASYNYACVKAMQRDKSEALASLEQILDAGTLAPAHVRDDPDWQHWAGDDELEALLARFENPTDE